MAEEQAPQAARERRSKRLLTRLRSTRSGSSLLRQEVTMAEAATAAGVDRSTIVRIRQVAKDGALAALSASKPGAGSKARDSEPGGRRGRGGPVVRGDQGDGGQADVGRGKRAHQT